MISLGHLKPDENGMVNIVSGKHCWSRFTDKMPYEKAIVHVREGSSFVKDENTIVKLHTQQQLKNIILNRDKGKCHYCGKKATTVDHKKPRSKGGYSTPVNLVSCCRQCNQRKGNLEYLEFINIIGNIK